MTAYVRLRRWDEKGSGSDSVDTRNMSVCVRSCPLATYVTVWTYRSYWSYLANSWTLRGHEWRAGAVCLTEIVLDRYAQAWASALMLLCEVALARQASLRSTRVPKEREVDLLTPAPPWYYTGGCRCRSPLSFLLCDSAECRIGGSALGARGRRRLALAELVVTTAVVVVLACLLLPVFARAR
jgi:hypothetical protein